MEEKLKSSIPGTVTVAVSKDCLDSLITKDGFEIMLPVQRGVKYDFSTLNILCGAVSTPIKTEFLIDKDLTHGIQLTIDTISDNGDPFEPENIVLKFWTDKKAF
ncbi:hypothetical protein [Chryseobacterium gossypii]|uniref:hypothetical protein n=1 Tax=Chryseobacterium gossypii TaxID=3231602 RepID=UPI0035266B72